VTAPSGNLKSHVAESLERYRRRTRNLIRPLNDDDVHLQHDSIMSPLVWDVGHVGNFEELWLLRQVGGRPAHDSRFDEIYNPFDNPRWTRGNLPLLSRHEALEYLDEVRGDALTILERTEFDPLSPLLQGGYVFEMVIQHEAQHQETMLQGLDLRTDLSPYRSAVLRSHRPGSRKVDDTERVVIPAGISEMGTSDTRVSYDNERPRHLVELPSFAIDRYPVTNHRYQRFIEAQGYLRRDLWTEEGWQYRETLESPWPQGWLPQVRGGWQVRRFGHLIELDPNEPVQHVSYHEADAFARFEGGRLPTEAEWEKAAAWDPKRREHRPYPWGQTPPTPSKANVDWNLWGPARVGTLPGSASAYGVEQMLGDVYEWTSSPFEGYPGFSSFPYPEYSEVFFGDPDYRVLRGASWATSTDVTRNTFRNWDYRERRQIFAGLRLAWDI
jgi:gamma-glutamyl hercynylcysteine S-oxide synthase